MALKLLAVIHEQGPWALDTGLWVEMWAIKKVRDHLLSYFEQEELSSGPIHRVGDMVNIKGAKHPTLWRICTLSGDVASDNRQWQADLVSQDHCNVDAKPGMDPGYTWENESGMSATVVAVDEQSCSCSVSLKTHLLRTCFAALKLHCQARLHLQSSGLVNRFRW